MIALMNLEYLTVLNFILSMLIIRNNIASKALKNYYVDLIFYIISLLLSIFSLVFRKMVSYVTTNS